MTTTATTETVSASKQDPEVRARIDREKRAQELQNRHDDNRAAYRDATAAGDTAAMRKLREEFAAIKGEIADHNTVLAAEEEMQREIEQERRTREYVQWQQETYGALRAWLDVYQEALSELLGTAESLVKAHHKAWNAREQAIQCARSFKNANTFAERLPFVLTIEHYARIAVAGRLTNDVLGPVDHLRPEHFEDWRAAFNDAASRLLGEQQYGVRAALRIIDAQMGPATDETPTPPEAA